MNDFDYDVKEKKALIASARKRKSGIYSKKCTLPSEYLTKKEKEKMNGEVKSYDLKKFITYEELCTIPVDIQAEYLHRLQDKYAVNIKNIAEAMDIHPSTLSHHCIITNIKLTRRPKKDRLAKMDEWMAFCGMNAYPTYPDKGQMTIVPPEEEDPKEDSFDVYMNESIPEEDDMEILDEDAPMDNVETDIKSDDASLDEKALKEYHRAMDEAEKEYAISEAVKQELEFKDASAHEVGFQVGKKFAEECKTSDSESKNNTNAQSDDMFTFTITAKVPIGETVTVTVTRNK